MIYLIEFERRASRLHTFQRFEDAERRRAATARLALEIRLNRAGIEPEVVLLEASDERALRRTHSRYFSTLRELAAELTA